MGNDLVLTIGVPLVAGLSVEQLAAVIAHELGHFSQGFGMRIYYLIHRVNAWFVRIVFKRDSWDLILEEWSQGRGLFFSIIIISARLAVWTSRQILKMIMLVGQAISCFMSRQQEYHADQLAIELAGSEIFEAETFRIHILGCALQNAYREMESVWKRQRALPSDFAAYLLAFDKEMPSELRQQIENTLGLASTGVFDTHPSPGDRIRCARRAAALGVFHLNQPASALLNNFEVLSKQVSLLHYSDDLRLPLGLARFYSVGDKNPAPEAGPPPSEQAPVSAGTKLRVSRNPKPT